MPRLLPHAPILPVRGANPLEALCDFAEARPLLSVQWTPPQLEFLRCDAPRKLLRCGNQIGKTWAGLSEVIFRALGSHPYLRTRPPPVEIWIVCTTWPQSVAVMQKFWSLVPKDQVVSPSHCDARYGFGKDNPAVVFRNGSIVRFRTTMQGAEALAGATIDFVLIDEPTDEDIYRELDRRLTRTNGQLALTLTPVNRPTEYLRELCERGAVRDLHYTMRPEYFVPVGRRRPITLTDGTPIDAQWIAEQRRLVPPKFAPVVLDGEWEFRVGDPVFPAFDPAEHVREFDLAEGAKLHLGWDHGEGDFREGAVVASVDDRGAVPRVGVYLESWGDGMSTPDHDAEQLLDAFDEAGVTWAELDSARGDKPTRSRLSKRSNEDLARALARAMPRRRHPGVRGGELHPGIQQAKTGKGGGRGSVWRGVEWLHRAMLTPGHFYVHPRCERVIESLQKWAGEDDSEWKDAIDAVRYAVWDYTIRDVRIGDARDWHVV